ncbi:hypothetical protein, partial [Amycolatopsis sp. NPDC000740]|uniref:hypothetical protein n=1 Tax=Amycolatopsis sp. NPDC000740 TaxID=3154269 RepID=UPI00332373C5
VELDQGRIDLLEHRKRHADYRNERVQRIDRLGASGTSITVDSAAGIRAAVTEALENSAYRREAGKVAAEIAGRPDPGAVIAEIAQP